MKNQLFLGKTWFWAGKPTFSLGERWFWREKLHFSSEKDGFGQETNFFLRKTKNTIFVDFGRIVSQKMLFLFFLVFPRKKLVSFPKPSFSWETVGFSRQSHFFPRKRLVFLPKTIYFLGAKKSHLFGVWPYSFSKDIFICVFLVFPRKSWFLIGRAQCCR